MTPHPPLDAPAEAPETSGGDGDDLEEHADLGYVLALTALLLVPLLAFTGFAVDLGAWYAQAGKLQRTADAASLAAVSYMPDESAARDAAEEVVERNGFDPADAVYTPIGTERYKVELTNPEADQYFTEMFVGNVSITRGATAEFVQRVELGSARNFIGTGDQLPEPLRENFKLSVNGPCSSREQGDLILPETTANFGWGGGGGGFRCEETSGPTANSFYDPDGYFLALRVPDDYNGPGTQYLRVYDAPECRDFANGAPFTTTYTVRPATVSRLDPMENPPTVWGEFTSGEHCAGGGGPGGAPCSTTPVSGNPVGNWEDRWCTLAVLNGLEPGDLFFVQIASSADNNGQQYINNYAFAVYTDQAQFDASRACSTDPDEPAYSRDWCVRIYAIEHLSVFADIAGADPEFYLAEIGPQHSNKQLQVDLFDVGEGTEYLEILEPDGDPATFSYEVIDETGADVAPDPQPGGGAWTGVVNRLYADGDLGGCDSGSFPQAGPHRTSDSRYNDRRIILTIDLPPDITDAYGGKYWWKVRYRTCTNPSDRTTWGAGVLGDPVRLIE